jgi:ABC-type Zn2+ transport system substrate-binding protein/surface adhesin
VIKVRGPGRTSHGEEQEEEQGREHKHEHKHKHKHKHKHEHEHEHAPVRDGLLRRELAVAVEEFMQVEARLQHLQPLVRVRLDGAACQEVLCSGWSVGFA